MEFKTFKLNWDFIRALFGEFIATIAFATLIYSVKISIYYSGATALGYAIVPISAFLGVTPIVYSFCDVSPAHFNPAVTLAAMMALKMNWIAGFCFIGVQVLGALAGAGLSYAWFTDFGGMMDLVVPRRNLNTDLWHGMFMEFICTFIFIYIYFAVYIGPSTEATDVKIESSQNEAGKDIEEGHQSNQTTTITSKIPANTPRGFFGMVIGFSYAALLVLAAGASNGIFNPAVVFAAELVVADFREVYIYLVPEFLAAPFAAAIYMFVLYHPKTESSAQPPEDS